MTEHEVACAPAIHHHHDLLWMPMHVLL